MSIVGAHGAAVSTLKPAMVRDVRIVGGFWGARVRVNRDVTLAAQYDRCKSTGRIDAFRLAWKSGEPNEPHIFWDSDVAKWIEAASYSLATEPDATLEALLDETIGLIAASQQADGYINSHYSCVEPDKRWSNLRDCHELYCVGHLIEAAVAHYQATGKRTLLDPLCRYADYIATVFGTGENQLPGYCGHEEIELALVRLADTTGEERYLDLARYFVDERGQTPYYFDTEARRRGESPDDYWAKSYDYCQASMPARSLETVAGHAVRAMYYYSAMADVAAGTGDAALGAACLRLWSDLTTKKMYVTGGLGPSRHNEGFTAEYDLPNETAYAETCAAIGLVFWAHRMLHLEGDAKYADVMERALYNGVLSGVSLGGDRFFYENPLSRHGAHTRVDWFGCACCPPNLARLLSSIGSYAYSSGPMDAAVHLYMNGSADLPIGASSVNIAVQTDYPWDGAIRIVLKLASPLYFCLRLRLPGWRRQTDLSVNGADVDIDIDRGYAVISRVWSDGDVVDLALNMQVERIYADRRVSADMGRIAVARGPLIYCSEEIDNQQDLDAYVVPREANFACTFDPNLLDGVVTVTGFVRRESGYAHGGLYHTDPPPTDLATLKMVPYYAWDNRGLGEMQVWMREA